MAKSRIAKRHQDDFGTVVGRPHHTLNDVAVLALAGRVQNLYGHHLHEVESDAGDAEAIVGARGDDARQPRTVAQGVGESVRIIDDRSARSEHACQVPVCAIKTRIEDGDFGPTSRDNVAVDLVPGDFGKRPLRANQRVGGQALKLPCAIGVHPEDVRGIRLHGCRDSRGGLRGHFDNMHIECGD